VLSLARAAASSHLFCQTASARAITSAVSAPFEPPCSARCARFIRFVLREPSAETRATRGIGRDPPPASWAAPLSPSPRNPSSCPGAPRTDVLGDFFRRRGHLAAGRSRRRESLRTDAAAADVNQPRASDGRRPRAEQRVKERAVVPCRKSRKRPAVFVHDEARCARDGLAPSAAVASRKPSGDEQLVVADADSRHDLQCGRCHSRRAFGDLVCARDIGKRAGERSIAGPADMMAGLERAGDTVGGSSAGCGSVFQAQDSSRATMKLTTCSWVVRHPRPTTVFLMSDGAYCGIVYAGRARPDSNTTREVAQQRRVRAHVARVKNGFLDGGARRGEWFESSG